MKTFVIFIAILLVSCSTKIKPPKNIILFIGDGMGIAQVTALTTVKSNNNLERFKIAGLLKTHSINDYVTDSAAGATAFATGEKTYNGAIAVSIDKKPLKTVLEYAEDLGKSTGLVATSGITHATPASFASHVDSRRKYNEIALQMSQSSVDVLMGGRLGNFLPQKQDSSLREDDLNPLENLQKKMNVALTLEEFRESPSNEALTYLYARKSPPRAEKRPASLREMTLKAIDILDDNTNGFFLMVEGSQIDWGGHANDQNYIISEILDFDEAVGAGLDFAQKNSETLILVTADHETGGFALLDGSLSEKKLTESNFISTHHTATMVPIFAYGPNAEIFGGIHDNIFVGKQIINFNK